MLQNYADDSHSSSSFYIMELKFNVVNFKPDELDLSSLSFYATRWSVAILKILEKKNKPEINYSNVRNLNINSNTLGHESCHIMRYGNIK